MGLKPAPKSEFRSNCALQPQKVSVLIERATTTESLRTIYSAGGIVQTIRTAYAHGSKYVPSDTHPPRQVPEVRKDWIGTCLSPFSEARPGWII